MKRLYRSKSNRILGGVCGGLGDYFGVDPVVMRLIWLVLFFLGGIGLVAYIIGVIIIPNEPVEGVASSPKEAAGETGKGRFLWGIILIGVGIVILAQHYRFHFWYFDPWIRMYGRQLVPLLLVGVGIYLLVTYNRETQVTGSKAGRITRSRTDKKIAGVCGGVAAYFNLDSTLVRVLWVLMSLFYGIGVVLYIIFMLVLPEELPDKTATADPEE